MPLSDLKLKKSKPKDKPYKISDEEGLYIFISPSGGKLWRMNYRFNNKQKTLSMGKYPLISLKQARMLRDEAKDLLAHGIDPSEHKRTEQLVIIEKTENTFENIAREWYKKNTPLWVERNQKKILSSLERNVFPVIGNMPIKELKAPDLMVIVNKLELQGTNYTAKRAIQYCGRIFRYAIQTARAEHDITADLRGAIAPHKQKHFASITEPAKVGELLRAIDSFDGHFTIACALKLSPLVFVRPSELRCAEWTEFDFEIKEWRIPEERMKMNEQHIVPLSKQTLAIVKELKKLTGTEKYLFPSVRTNSRPISDNTINASLRRLGYTKEQMTAHGFRSLASTLLNEQGVKQRPHRTPASPQGTQFRKSSLQLRPVSPATHRNDARLGRLPRHPKSFMLAVYLYEFTK